MSYYTTYEPAEQVDNFLGYIGPCEEIGDELEQEAKRYVESKRGTWAH